MLNVRWRLRAVLFGGLALLTIGQPSWGQGASRAAGGARAVGIEPVNAVAPDGNAALFVGVNQFKAMAGLQPLRYAVNDAVSQAYLFAVELKIVEPANCIVALGGEPSTEQARTQLKELEAAGVRRIEADRTSILIAVTQVTQIPRQPGDLLVVSISSHGFEEGGVPFVMPTDGLRSMLTDTAINLASLEQHLDHSSAGKRLLIVDACREKALAGGKGGEQPMSAQFTKALANARGAAALFSCGIGQISYENEQLGHGAFTYFLLQGAHGSAQSDERGIITLGSIVGYASDEIGRWIGRNLPGIAAADVQKPWFKGDEIARQIPLGLDPKVREERAKLAAQVSKVIDALKARINFKGPFTPALYARLAEALDSAASGPPNPELLAAATEFAAGHMPEAVFAAYLEKVLTPPDLSHRPREPDREPVASPAQHVASTEESSPGSIETSLPLSATRKWYAHAQPLAVRTKADAGGALVFGDFGQDPRLAASKQIIAGNQTVDLRQLFPRVSEAGTYLLYLVPTGTKVSLFAGAPLVIETRSSVADPVSKKALPLVTKIQPLEYASITTDLGRMTAIFYYDAAPATVDNFIQLSRDGFYDGLGFHRIVPGFVIQGGDPAGDGTGGPGYTVTAEFNDRKHESGVLSMARQSDPNERTGALPRSEYANSAGSQFFVCLDYNSTKALDHKYTAFGRIVRGMDVVNVIAATPVADVQTGRPVKIPSIQRIQLKLVSSDDNPYGGS